MIKKPLICSLLPYSGKISRGKIFAFFVVEVNPRKFNQRNKLDHTRTRDIILISQQSADNMALRLYLGEGVDETPFSF